MGACSPPLYTPGAATTLPQRHLSDMEIPMCSSLPSTLHVPPGCPSPKVSEPAWPPLHSSTSLSVSGPLPACLSCTPSSCPLQYWFHHNHSPGNIKVLLCLSLPFLCDPTVALICFNYSDYTDSSLLSGLSVVLFPPGCHLPRALLTSVTLTSGMGPGTQ